MFYSKKKYALLKPDDDYDDDDTPNRARLVIKIWLRHLMVRRFTHLFVIAQFVKTQWFCSRGQTQGPLYIETITIPTPDTAIPEA